MPVFRFGKIDRDGSLYVGEVESGDLASRLDPASLACREVHIWFISFDELVENVSRFKAFLSPDERQRALSFAFDRDRNRYIAARGWLRTLIGLYLHREPSCVRFSFGPYGKPYLSSQSMQFNMAYSYGAAIYAFTQDRTVGVDLELVRSLTDIEQIIARSLAPVESRALYQLSDQRRLEAFFTVWTLKEAFLKALGCGLAFPCDRFAVSYGTSEKTRLIHLNGRRDETQRWVLQTMKPFVDYVASLAVERDAWR